MTNTERVRVTSYGKGGKNHSWVTIEGLTEEEERGIIAVVNGHWWTSVNSEGRLKFFATREELPGPAEDEEMMPYWRHPILGEGVLQHHLFDSDALSYSISPSIVVQHLCGYYYTPENYRKQVKKLESYGFECLRSRRGDDGRFWEIWFLSGLWAAKGDLKVALAGNEAKDVEKVVRFLCTHASFGTLDVVVQRAAMQID